MSQSWWSVKELASHYSLSERTIYDAIARGDLVAHRFGRKRGGLRISEEARLAWQARCETPHQLPSKPQPRLTLAPASLVRKHFQVGRGGPPDAYAPYAG